MLHYINKKDIPRLFSENNFAECSRLMSVVTHEQVHWLDLVSTVWGQEYIISLFDAYLSILGEEKHNKEENWWKVIHLYDQDRRIMFPSYYKTLNLNTPDHNIRKPWSLDFSVGQEFQSNGKIDPSNPILFAIFGSNPGRTRIARHPISVGTLLECNAVHFEMMDEFNTIKLIEDDSERRVELLMRANERTDSFYDPELLEYTSAAHILSSVIKTSEAFITYRLSSIISSICLNLTREHFNNLVIPNFLKNIDSSIIRAFKNACNRGFAFVCIVFSARSYEEGMNENSWVEDALQNAGLPDRVKLVTDSIARLSEINKTLSGDHIIDSVRNYIISVGQEIFPIRAICNVAGNPILLREKGVVFPGMFDSEGDLFNIFPEQLDPELYSPEIMFNLEWELREFRSNFLNACRTM